jgi:hypothetical protein
MGELGTPESAPLLPSLKERLKRQRRSGGRSADTGGAWPPSKTHHSQPKRFPHPHGSPAPLTIVTQPNTPPRPSPFDFSPPFSRASPSPSLSLSPTRVSRRRS